MRSPPGTNESPIPPLQTLSHAPPLDRDADLSPVHPEELPGEEGVDSSQSRLTIYVRWKLHEQVTLECDNYTINHPDPPPATGRLPPWPRCRPHRPVRLPSMTTDSSGKTQITIYIERILSRNVAVVLDCHNPNNPARWVVKFYRDNWEASTHLSREVQAYTQCPSIQGSIIPIFYGEWRICGTPEGSCSALLLEFVSPGTTVSSIRDGFLFVPKEERASARHRLGQLHSSATRAVDKLNECGVVHEALGGENMVLSVSEERGWDEAVVLVDFAWAGVFNPALENRYDEWRGFHQAFVAEYARVSTGGVSFWQGDEGWGSGFVFS